MKVTIKDVAKKAGVSITAVSQVIGNSKEARIGPHTRKKILKCALSLDYTPHPIAAALRLQKSSTISLIIPDINNQAFLDIVSGVQEAATARGYEVLIQNCNRDAKKEIAFIKHSQVRRVDGIIMSPTENISQYLPVMDKIPFVFLYGFKNRIHENKNFDYVIENLEKGFYNATKYLIELGHKKIALLIRTLDYSLKYRRIDGYQRALKEYGINFNKSLIYETKGFDIEAGYKSGEELAKKKNNFTALLVYNDVMAIGVMEAFLESGVKIPDNISLIGCDGIEFGNYCKVPLTSIKLPTYQIGKEAVRLLLERISGKVKSKKEVRRVLLEPELLIRSSCARI